MNTKEQMSKITKLCGIYAIRDTSRDKIVYVGKTGQRFIRRWCQHLIESHNGIHGNPMVAKLILLDCYRFEIIESWEYRKSDKQLLDAREKFYMNEHDTLNSGHNIQRRS